MLISKIRNIEQIFKSLEFNFGYIEHSQYIEQFFWPLLDSILNQNRNQNRFVVYQNGKSQRTWCFSLAFARIVPLICADDIASAHLHGKWTLRLSAHLYGFKTYLHLRVCGYPCICKDVPDCHPHNLKI